MFIVALFYRWSIDRQRCYTVIHETVDTRYGKDEGRQKQQMFDTVENTRTIPRRKSLDVMDIWEEKGNFSLVRRIKLSDDLTIERGNKLDRLLRQRVVIFTIRKEK